MKKLVLAAAIASMLSGAAFAAVNLDTGTGSVNYASERVVAGTTALTGAVINATATTGFGVVSGQTRFVRFALTNGTFATAVVDADMVFGPVAPANVIVVQGGGAGQDFVVFQIQADVDVGQADTVTFALGSGIGVIPTAANAPVQLSYSLYSDAPSAAAGGSSGRLNTANNTARTVAGLVTGLAYSSTSTTTTVDVSATTGAYTKFIEGVAGTSATVAQLGTLSLGAATNVLDPATGLQVTYAALVAAGTKLVLTATNSLAAATGGDIFIGSDGGDCGAPAISDTNVDRTATTASIVTGTTVLAAVPLCFSVANNNSTSMAAQTFTTAVDLVAAANSTAADFAGISSGTFVRNGTVLKAAFSEASTVSGTASAVSLTNTSGSAAPFTTRCLTSGSPVVGTPGSVPANSSGRFSIVAALGCPAAVRGLELTFSVPTGSVIGSVVRQNLTTGVASFDGMVGNQ